MFAIGIERVVIPIMNPNGIDYYIEFVEKEIINDLPQEVQKDFQDSIAYYRKYAATLKQYMFDLGDN